jgi:hypothetical protein
MSHRLVVRPKAAEEIVAIYIWMEAEKQGKGERFLAALDVCYAFFLQYPLGAQLRVKHYRHMLLEGFDYRVVYAIIGETVNVYQVRHTSRRPSKRFGP